MIRDRFFSLLRLQILQEQRSGVGYWCAPDLKEALRSLYVRPSETAFRPGAARPSAQAGGLVRPGAAAPSARADLPEARAASISPRGSVTPAGGLLRSADISGSPAQGSSTPGNRFARPPAHIAPLASGGSSSGPGSSSASARSSAGSSMRHGATSSGAQPPRVRPTWGPAPAATGREAGWEAKLRAVEAEATGCTRCPLREGCNKVVFGVGGATVPLVFVGEAPGAEEDRQGIPFVGRAGELLTRIVEAIGLKREQVYICNVLKCRPPGNRDPEPDEVATCAPFLTRQLEILKPKVICTLGRHSTLFLTGEIAAMKNLRGQVFDYRGVKVVPTYHPAALLRNPALKPLVWEDVQKVRALLDAE